MSESLLSLALEAGFEHAALCDAAALESRADVRAMCAADKCHAYGKNWTCPPVCGTPDECGARMRCFASCLLVQTVGALEDDFDFEGMQALEKLHLERFHRLADTLRAREPGILCLGSGGCRICGTCAWPEPCRFPQRACSSMEAYGLLVSDVCKKAGLAYYYGKDTLAYTACYLFGTREGA
jgi:predicted metal-binding protein